MNDAAATDRGLALLTAHCLSLDPQSRTARERLDAAIGAELAHMLVFALSAGGGSGVRAVFAA